MFEMITGELPFDGAVKYALGSEYHIDELWREYQRVMEEEK